MTSYLVLSGDSAQVNPVTALLSPIHAVFQTLEQKSDVSLMFFDLHKSFDNVPHIYILLFQHQIYIRLNSPIDFLISVW